MNDKNKISRFAWVMAILSIIAVLLGVSVFYWLLQYEPVRSTGNLSALAQLIQSMEHE